MNPLVQKVIQELGITLSYYVITKYGGNILYKIDATILNVLKGIVEEGKIFEYKCISCKETMDLFENEGRDKEHIRFIDQCDCCKSYNIILKTK